MHKMVVNCRAYAHSIRFRFVIDEQMYQKKDTHTGTDLNTCRTFVRAEKDFLQ